MGALRTMRCDSCTVSEADSRGPAVQDERSASVAAWGDAVDASVDASPARDRPACRGWADEPRDRGSARYHARLGRHPGRADRAAARPDVPRRHRGPDHRVRPLPLWALATSDLTDKEWGWSQPTLEAVA